MMPFMGLGLGADGAAAIATAARRQPVASIAALKALTPSDGDAVNVLGYYASGDGGGGTFYYDGGSSATDNGGTIIAPTEGDGRWLRAYGGDVNVRWFGAKGDSVAISDAAMTSGSVTLTSSTAPFLSTDVGKRCVVSTAGTSNAHLVTTIASYNSAGSVDLAAAAGATVSAVAAYVCRTDDSAKIQEAVNTGLPVIVPDGVFFVDTGINPAANNVLHMQGVSRRKSILIADAAGSSYIIKQSGDDQSFFLKDITFACVDYAHYSMGNDTARITDVSVENCDFATMLHGGAFWRGIVTGLGIVRGCSFSEIRSPSGTCTAVRFGGNTGETETGRAVAENNRFKNLIALASSTETHAVILYTKEAIISGNRIHTCYNVNTSSTGDEAIYTKSQHCVISNNTIYDGGGGAGFITVKGNSYFLADDTNPRGNFARVVNNFLSGGSSARAPEATIAIHSDFAIVQGNILQGPSGTEGIKAITEYGITIADNAISKFTGTTAIAVRCNGWSVVERNRIVDLLGNGSVETAGIKVSIETAGASQPTVVNVVNNSVCVSGTPATTGRIHGIIMLLYTNGVINSLHIKENMLDVAKNTPINARSISLVTNAGSLNDIGEVITKDNTSIGSPSYHYIFTGSGASITREVVSDNSWQA